MFPLRFTSLPAACLLLLATVIPGGLHAQATPTPAPTPSTYEVQNGAAPWYDRVRDLMLGNLPAWLKSSAKLPQQSCARHDIRTPPGAKALLIGVATTDLLPFHTSYPASKRVAGSFEITSPARNSLPYTVVYLPSPPEIVKADTNDGIILLRIDPPALSPTAVVAWPAPFVPPIQKSDFDLYLLIGQSNMLGRDTSKLAGQIDNPRIAALDHRNKWAVAREPMFGGSGTGPGISFATAMLAGRPAGVKIGLIPCAVGGTPLSRWVKGADLYKRALARALAAMPTGTLRGVLWHQGESDSNKIENASTYAARLTAMFVDLRADLGSPDLPIVVGQLGSFINLKDNPYMPDVNQALAKVASTVPHVGLASSKGLTDKGDLLHFNAESQVEFGKRYAEAMRKLQQGKQGL